MRRAGKRIAYSDQAGFEMEWRQHDTSAFSRQLWLYDVAANTHKRLTAPGAEEAFLRPGYRLACRAVVTREDVQARTGGADAHARVPRRPAPSRAG